MKLQPAPPQYDRGQEQEMRNQIERGDAENHKKGRHLDLGGDQFYVVLYSPDGNRWSVTVSNAGALVVTAL